MESTMRIKPLLDIDNILSKQTTGYNRKFNYSYYSSLMKPRKNSAWIMREAYLRNGTSCRGKIMAIIMPNGAGESNETFIFTRETSHKPVKLLEKLEEDQTNRSQKTTSVASIPKWMLIDSDVLYLLLEVRRIEHLFIAICILFAWWGLCLLIFFLHRFYSKNVRK